MARRQADQIYNLSLTRTATVLLGQGVKDVIGVGRVKTPTLAIVCRRELEIRDFVTEAYFEVIATAKVDGGQFQMRHVPRDRIVKRELAQDLVNAAQGLVVKLGFAFRINGKAHLSCMIYRHCRKCVVHGLAGLPQRRFNWLKSYMMAKARRSLPIRVPKCVTCQRV